MFICVCVQNSAPADCLSTREVVWGSRVKSDETKHYWDVVKNALQKLPKLRRTNCGWEGKNLSANRRAAHNHGQDTCVFMYVCMGVCLFMTVAALFRDFTKLGIHPGEKSIDRTNDFAAKYLLVLRHLCLIIITTQSVAISVLVIVFACIIIFSVLYVQTRILRKYFRLRILPLCRLLKQHYSPMLLGVFLQRPTLRLYLHKFGCFCVNCTQYQP